MQEFLSAKKNKLVVDRLAEDPNVLGVGVGPKEVGNKPTGDLALKFYVRAKARTKDQDKALAKSERIPRKVADVATDVVQMGPLRARGPFTQHIRPGLGGGSGNLPMGALQVRTDFGAPGYGGPCPPEGDHPHRYLFTIRAVGMEALPVTADTSAAVVGFFLNFNTLDKASLMGLYKR